MSKMSDYLRSQVYNHTLRTSSYSKPTTIALALCSTPPSKSQTGATIPEIANANGYARYPNASGNPNWAEAVPGSGYNITEFLWADATGDWGWVSGIAFVDSATYGAGNQVLFGTLVTPKEVRSGDAFRIKVSGVQVWFE